MASDSFSQAFRPPLRWTIREGLLIAGIFTFWLGLGLVFLVALGLIAFLVQALEIARLRFVYDLLRLDGFVWAAVTPLASAATGLFVLVRAGTVLIDRYNSTNEV